MLVRFKENNAGNGYMTTSCMILIFSPNIVKECRDAIDHAHPVRGSRETLK